MEYPVTKLVHWPTKLIETCDHHAQRLEKLAKILGYHIGIAKVDPNSQCAACVREARGKTEDQHDVDQRRR